MSREFGGMQEYQLRELKMLFDTTLRLIVEQSSEVLNVATMIYTFLALDEI